MALPREEIYRFEAPACAMCIALNLDPYELVQIAIDGEWPPQWWIYAQRMAEHEIMVRLMRECGSPV